MLETGCHYGRNALLPRPLKGKDKKGRETSPFSCSPSANNVSVPAAGRGAHARGGGLSHPSPGPTRLLALRKYVRGCWQVHCFLIYSGSEVCYPTVRLYIYANIKERSRSGVACPSSLVRERDREKIERERERVRLPKPVRACAGGGGSSRPLLTVWKKREIVRL